MLPIRTPGSVFDRILAAILTFLAVGCVVISLESFGERFAWGLLSAVLPLGYWNATRARGLAGWASLPLFLVTVLNGSPIAMGIHCGFILGALARSGCFYGAFLQTPPGKANVLPLSILQQVLLMGLCAGAWEVIPHENSWLWKLSLVLMLGLVPWSYRSMFELLCEPILRVMYRIRWHGPGTRQFPPRGGVLVLANHACWFDPMFMGKILIRPMTPMMTSRFYDIWFLRPLLKYIFRVIVVPDVERRKDAPELRDAITSLKRGECVLIFPEGYLRRTEDKPLRRFGQGAWQILKECPDVPVVACWIEGGWGSFCSFKDGPPTKNKTKDIGRPVQIGLSAPVVIPAEVLADQMQTRFHLMNLVSTARIQAGLEALPAFEIPTDQSDKEV